MIRITRFGEREKKRERKKEIARETVQCARTSHDVRVCSKIPEFINAPLRDSRDSRVINNRVRLYN